MLSALAATLCLLLAPPPDSGEVLVIAACGALSALALATGSPLTWGLCFLAAFALFGVRWVSTAPARATLAAARVATLGAAALVAAAPFLPVDPTSLPPRAHIAGGLLAGGVAAGFALVPVGGWVAGGSRLVRGASLAPWALLLVPALVLTTQPLQGMLPTEARLTFAAVLLPAGTVSAVWGALRGSRGRPTRERYPRVLLADLGLVAMGLATPTAGRPPGEPSPGAHPPLRRPRSLSRSRHAPGPACAASPGWRSAGPSRAGLLGALRPWSRAHRRRSGARCWPSPSRWPAPSCWSRCVPRRRVGRATRRRPPPGRAARPPPGSPPLAALIGRPAAGPALRALLGVG